MIIVSNTKELEEKYNLGRLPDDEKVIVQGGLRGKLKYNQDIYQIRTTYTVRQIKQIINQMKLIESQIPKQWNEYQRAKYIYEVLGRNIEYDFNRKGYETQQSSNLTGLLSRKAICAGYSLIYKEMMDRQGIQCDYIRGIGETDSGKREKHAWNVLTINGQSFPVDLTWDSDRMRNGETQLQYFGVDNQFESTHINDFDERNYRYTTYSRSFIDSIDTSSTNEQEKISEEQKMSIIQFNIEKTYMKFKQKYGEEIATTHIRKAIDKYINTRNANSFTRQGNARQQLEQYVSPDDMLDLMIKFYVERVSSTNQQQTVLGNALKDDMLKYDSEHATRALERYIKRGQVCGFTRNNNARGNVIDFVPIESARKSVINMVIGRTIKDIEQANSIYDTIIDEATNGYFYGSEFAKVQLPKEKRKGVMVKAVEWIKEKMKEKQNVRNIQNTEQNRENTENER